MLLKEQSCVELYNAFCRELRAFQVADAAGTRICKSCGQARSMHDMNGSIEKCSMSTKDRFLAMDAERETRVKESLSHLEQLARLNGWEW